MYDIIIAGQYSIQEKVKKYNLQRIIRKFLIKQLKPMSKNIDAHILKYYNIVQEMGSGAYGHVWKVIDKKQPNKIYALKKIFDAFRNPIDAQRTYREVQVLYKLKHPNIIDLKKVHKAQNNKDLYLLFQYMEADLHSVVGTNILEKIHQIYIFYQILLAIKYTHSVQLIHRDIKPSNVLINSMCKAKICDFGLVRAINKQQQEQIVLSQQVATKWYRAPQLLLGSRKYSKPVDMWSFGCIIVQVLIGRPLFDGDSTLQQLKKILQFCGIAKTDDIEALHSPVAEQLISQIKIRKNIHNEIMNIIDEQFHQLIDGLIVMNPNKRFTAQQALKLHIFDSCRQQQRQNMNSGFNSIVPSLNDNVRLNIKAYREKIYSDIKKRYKNIKDKNQVKRKVFSAGSKNKLTKSRSSSKEKSKTKLQSPDKPKIRSYSPKQLHKMKSPVNNKQFKKIHKENAEVRVNPKLITKINNPNTTKLKKKSTASIKYQKQDILKSIGIRKSKNFANYIS